MSAFDTNTQEQTSFLEKLVGEGKKFKDAEALAKGKLESDNHISNLERQLTELREDLTKQSKTEELLELVRSLKDQGTAPISPRGNENVNGEGNDHDNTRPGLTEEKLKELIESTVSQRESVSQQAKNLSEVEAILAQKFGEKSASVVLNHANELGMSVKELRDIAARNPRAFYQLLGVNQTHKESSTLVGNVRPGETVASSNAGERNFAFYQKMRRENKTRYFTPEVQIQMQKDAEQMGPDFFN